MKSFDIQYVYDKVSPRAYYVRPFAAEIHTTFCLYSGDMHAFQRIYPQSIIVLRESIKQTENANYRCLYSISIQLP